MVDAVAGAAGIAVRVRRHPGLPKLGAAATISILVASQLCMGLLVDVYRAGPAALRENLPALFGALLLVAGAYLVAKRSF